jgi:hypothetical protein
MLGVENHGPGQLLQNAQWVVGVMLGVAAIRTGQLPEQLTSALQLFS